MHIEDFKTWHWVVLGPLIGLIFGCVLLYLGPSSDEPGIATLDQGRFERAVSATPGGRSRNEAGIEQIRPDLPLLENVVVHPPLSNDATNTYWVTGRIFTLSQRAQDPKDPNSPMVLWSEWEKFRYPAKAPYHALVVIPGAYTTVAEFLKTLQKQSPKVAPSYRYAWWDNSAAMLTMPALAGLLIIGIAWPMTINLMQGAGLAPVPKPKAKVKLPKSRKAVAKPVIDHRAGDEQLAQLNEQMEQDLAAASVSLTSTIDANAKKEEAPIRLLNSGADQGAGEATTEQERLIREYGGEFYPVVKKIHKEGEEQPPAKK